MSKYKQFFTIREAEYIRANYLTTTDREIGKAIGRQPLSIRNFRTRNNLTKPPTFKIGQFPKGNKPWNTGKPVRLNPATEFKPGMLPHNTKEDGAISIRTGKNGKESYKYLRISLDKWVLLHRHIWQQERGEIPKGYLVIFRNGDTMDCRIENLECISRAESMKRNANRKKAGESLRKVWQTVQIMEANGMKHRYGLRSKYTRKNAA